MTRCCPRWTCSREHLLPALRAAVLASTSASRLRPPTTWAGARPTASTGQGQRRQGDPARPGPAVGRGGRRPAAVGLPGAVAVELVHNFSLLHDDLMDGDVERRHRLHGLGDLGLDTAILTGDALLALAHEVVLEAGTPAAGAGRAAARRPPTRELTRRPGAGRGVREAGRRDARRVHRDGQRLDRLAAGGQRRDRRRAGRCAASRCRAARPSAPRSAWPSSSSTTCRASGATWR